MNMAVCNCCAGFGKVGASRCNPCGGTGQVPEYHTGRGGKPSSNTCFSGDTKVFTLSGLCRIDSIVKGQRILSLGNTSQAMMKNVIRVKKHETASVTAIHTKRRSFNVTPNHTVQTTLGKSKVCNLQIDDHLVSMSSNGDFKTDRIIKIDVSTHSEPVYNLIIEDNYNFLVDGCVAYSFTKFPIVQQTLWNGINKCEQLVNSCIRRTHVEGI